MAWSSTPFVGIFVFELSGKHDGPSSHVEFDMDPEFISLLELAVLHS